MIIYISAMNFGGAPDKLLDMARNGDIVLAIFSDPIVTSRETRSVSPCRMPRTN
jgi:hypothetical protein